jgi:hypothetical protein
MADRFEKYRFTALSFEFTTVVPTTTPGVVCLSIDYDPNDAELPTPDQDGRAMIMSHVGAIQMPIWTSKKLVVPSDQLRKVGERWVRNWTGEGPTVEARTADLGWLYIGVFGIYSDRSSFWVGDLRVTYTVELMLPQMHSPSQTSGPQILTLSADYGNQNIPEVSQSGTPTWGMDYYSPLGVDRTAFEPEGGAIRYNNAGPLLLTWRPEIALVDNVNERPGAIEVLDSFEGRLAIELEQLPVPAGADHESDLSNWMVLTGPQVGWDTPTVPLIDPAVSDRPGKPPSGAGSDLYLHFTTEKLCSQTEGNLATALRTYVVEMVGSFLKGTFIYLAKSVVKEATNFLTLTILAEPRALLSNLGLMKRQRWTIKEGFSADSPRRTVPRKDKLVAEKASGSKPLEEKSLLVSQGSNAALMVESPMSRKPCLGRPKS